MHGLHVFFLLKERFDAQMWTGWVQVGASFRVGANHYAVYNKTVAG